MTKTQKFDVEFGHVGPSAWPTLDELEETIVGQRTQWLVPYRDRHTHIVQQTVSSPNYVRLERSTEAIDRSMVRLTGVYRSTYYSGGAEVTKIEHQELRPPTRVGDRLVQQGQLLTWSYVR